MHRPDLSRAKRLAVDIETCDPLLKEKGPGVYRRDGYILGVSLSDGEGFNEYYDLGHIDTDGNEAAKNMAWLRETLGTSCLKIGQNFVYDLDWLENWLGVKVNGPLASVDIAEALLDENQGKYNLDFMARKYFGLAKVKTTVDAYAEQLGLHGDSRAHLWRMPHDVVREYAKGDADLTIRIYDAQKPLLERDELTDLYSLECELVRCLLLFRKTGVRMDADRRDRNSLKIQSMIEIEEQKLFAEHGEFNYGSSKQVADVFDRVGIKYPVNIKYADGSSAEGVYLSDVPQDGIIRINPNIDAAFYVKHRDAIPLVKTLYELRRMKHHLSTFLQGSYVDYVTDDGLIHCSFYNMRNDDFGTRSGRFSSANPNLQQQPSRGVDEYWGTVCREVFIPFEDCWWGKADYSQIEYRFLAHFAVGPGSDELRAAYAKGDVDYHQYIMDLTSLKRRYAKNLNFGVAFGMGAKKMAEMFGWELDYCYEILRIYHERAPYVKSTVLKVEEVAKRRGYIKTFLKRRSHLVDKSKAYTMFCRLLQGSAADLMKKGMLDAYKAGLFDVLHPHVTVHDEIDVSVPKTKVGIEAYLELKHVMETCLSIRVPIVAELGIGDNWAKAEGKEGEANMHKLLEDKPWNG